MKPLTELQISKLHKDPRVQAAKGPVRIGTGYPNLKINVRKSGAKSWVFIKEVNGRATPLGLGSFPDLSLDGAQREVLKLKQQLHEGVAMATHKVKKIERQQTFLDLAKIYLCRMTKDNTLAGEPIEVAPVTFNQHKKTLIERCKKLHNVPFIDISAELLAEVVEDFWLTPSAEKWVGQIRTFLDFGQSRLNCDWDAKKMCSQVTETRMVVKEEHVERHEGSLSIDDLKKWYKRMDSDDRALQMQPRDRLVCKIGALLHKRLNEIVKGKWKEIDFSDMDNVIWTIPKTRMKTNKKRTADYQMPVPKVVARMLLDWKKRNSLEWYEGVGDEDWIFPRAPRKKSKDNIRSIDPAAISHALDKFCPLGMGVEGYKATPHGTNRSTFQTWAEAQQDPNNPGNGKYSHDAIEVQLDHALDGGKVRKAYDRDNRWNMRKILVEDYAKLILG